MKLALSSPVVLGLLLASCPGGRSAGAEAVWLSALNLSQVVQGWGVAQADKSVTGKPLSIGGKTFAHGLGTHADSLVRLELKGGTEEFSALVGIDDAAGNDSARVQFMVIGDGKTLFKSGPMKLGEPAEQIALNVRGMKTLLLEADAVGSIAYAHADWAEARLRVSGQVPEIVGPPREEAVILTPKPPRTPRINGARIFGVRPGHPFLFTVAATGERPMRFAAEGLPEGLKLDSVSGQITGRLETRGTYIVRLRASNALGEAERRFRVVCGDTLALTPHMGWNSWYVWENHVTDAIMRSAADAMVKSGMINHGYQYVNIDDCWAVKPGAADPSVGGEPRDAQGRINANSRFPDMKALTQYIHAKGLKSGIYTARARATRVRISTSGWMPSALRNGVLIFSNTIGARMGKSRRIRTEPLWSDPTN